MEIKVVPMTADHLEELEKLERICFSRPWSRKMLAEELENECAAFLVAEDAATGKVVGYAGLLVVADEGYITNVAVFPAYRRRGVAAQLIQVFIKFAKGNRLAFLTLEDLAGSVEIIVFPRDYEKYASKLLEDAKIFVTGRASVEEDRDGKIILESMMTFDEVPKTLWIKFPAIEEYERKERVLLSILSMSEGNDSVVIFCEQEKQMKKLPVNQNVKADEELMGNLRSAFGEENIKLV